MAVHQRPRKNRGRIILIQAAIALVIVIVLTALIAGPMIESAERDKTAEAFRYLTAVRDAQAKYHVRLGTYADDIARLQIDVPAPEAFAIGTPVAGDTRQLEDSWSLTLTRNGGFGLNRNYKVIFTDKGFDHGHSDLPEKLKPSPDVYAQLDAK